MQRTQRLPKLLRLSALILTFLVLPLWISTGAHLGWTQTSRVITQHDEVTGIDYPIREKNFTAGLDLLTGGIVLSGILCLGAQVAQSRTKHRSTTFPISVN